MSKNQRSIKAQEHVVRLLEALIVRGRLVPLDAYPIRAVASVTTDLRKIAKLALHSGRAW